MPHKRIEIRNKLVELFKQYLDVGGRVYASRPRPIWLKELPVVLIYFTRETADHMNREPRRYRRILTLNTHTVMHGHDLDDFDIDRFLDERAHEVEAIIDANRYLGLDYVHDSRLVETIPTIVTDEGDQPYASIVVTHEIEYETEAVEVGQLDEFLRFDTDYQNQEGQQLARDEVKIRDA
jgi:hypothetical protein